MTEKNYEKTQMEALEILGISKEKSRELLEGEVAIGGRGLIAKLLRERGNLPTIIETEIKTAKEQKLKGEEAYQYIRNQLTNYQIMTCQIESLW